MISTEPGMTSLEMLMLLSQIFSTIFMAGVIWFVQIVHYPLFAVVGDDQFARYEQMHRRATTWVVAPAMLVELASAAALIAAPPPPLPVNLLWIGLLLVAIIWLSTALLQVPLHNVLSNGFSKEHLARLLATNWIRTISWTARAVLMLVFVHQLTR